MKLSNLLSIIMIAFILLFIAFCEDEKEKEVTEKEVPQAVLRAFTTSYPGATVKEYTEEIEEGQKFYEISCEFEGRKIDAIYKPDGKVAGQSDRGLPGCG